MGTYSDPADTSAYPTYLLNCGHTKPIEPTITDAARTNPAVTVWCPRCALNVHITREQT